MELSQDCHELWRQPVLRHTSHSVPQLTVAKAFDRFTNAINRFLFCSLHFSCNWRLANIMATVPRSLRKLHCDSGKISSAIFAIILCGKTLARTSPATSSREIPLLLPRMDLSPLFMYIVTRLVFPLMGNVLSISHIHVQILASYRLRHSKRNKPDGCPAHASDERSWCWTDHHLIKSKLRSSVHPPLPCCNSSKKLCRSEERDIRYNLRRSIVEKTASQRALSRCGKPDDFFGWNMGISQCSNL